MAACPVYWSACYYSRLGKTPHADVVSNITAQARRLYRLGIRCVSRSSLFRVNESQPCELHEALFAKLLARCQSRAPKRGC